MNCCKLELIQEPIDKQFFTWAQLSSEGERDTPTVLIANPS